MRTHTRALAFYTLAAAVLLQACGGGGGTPAPTAPAAKDVSGSWSTFTETLTDVGNSTTCNDTGTVVVTQTAAKFTGATTQTGTCHTPSGPQDNAGVEQITTGFVSGILITWTEPGNPDCLYSGQIVGDPAVSASGSVSCTGNGFFFSGGWQMKR